MLSIMRRALAGVASLAAIASAIPTLTTKGKRADMSSSVQD